MGVGEKLLEYIAKQGISISELAEKSGISQERLHIEAAKDWTAQEFLDLCLALGVKAELFYN